MNLFSINKWRPGSGNNATQSTSSQVAKQNVLSQVREIAQLIEDGPPRLDGSDKFFGMENVVNGEKFGNTCYCNSILQCLYFSKPFRECVVNFPHRAMLSQKDLSAISSTFAPQAVNGNGTAMAPNGGRTSLQRINTESTTWGGGAHVTSPNSTMRSSKSPLSPISPKDDTRRKSIPMVAAIQPAAPVKIEDPNSPEAKKKAALATGPVLKVDAGNYGSYGMQESLFSALKDIFETIIAHNSRTGVISPQKFVEILKRDNEMFRSSLHQDAHEFLNYVLNQVIENVEQYQRKLANASKANGSISTASQKGLGSLTPGANSSAASTTSETTSSTTAVAPLSTGWIHDLFEGLLTSETKCLTCETISRRDEVFLDLSIDLDKHASVTSCLRNFSASEMLCERNKFHCDCCGGLQEAEKRMKIKRLPRILALHLKRFKYSEEAGRHQKLFHRVVYPYYLRLFNTTDDAEDPDRLYELYAVVVHIGGGPYHGHYVTIVKTEDKGWLLFDDELVEPVDKSYVRNFFGDEKKLACAYVLFYQETTFEKMQKDMQEETGGEVQLQATNISGGGSDPEKLGLTTAYDVSEVVEDEKFADKAPLLTHALTSPLPIGGATPEGARMPAAAALEDTHVTIQLPKSKKEREREKKDQKAAMKLAAKLATGEEVLVGEKEKDNQKGFTRFKTTSKSMARGHSWFGGSGAGVLNGKDKKDAERKSYDNGVLQEETAQGKAVLTANGTAVNGNGAAKVEKVTEEVSTETLERSGEDQQTLLQSTPQISASKGKDDTAAVGKTKEKKKGLFAGLRRKRSIMME